MEGLIWLVLGLALLVAGAEGLVRGAGSLAGSFGISPLVIGLTVVAYGTSTPELAVSLKASLSGQVDIALANVVGSNIFNVLFILGMCALIAPLIVVQQLVRVDVPLMVGVSILCWLFALSGRIGRLEGLVLVLGVAAYTAVIIRKSRRESREVAQEYAREYGPEVPRVQATRPLVLDLALILGGLGLLIVGSRWFVDGAVAMARTLGLSETVVGLTIVAAGTSSPEVATSIIATLRGARDIAVGNVVGSNLYNILAILGLSALLTPGGVPVAPALLRFDIPVMVAVALACLPIFFTGHVIARWEGAVFLGYFVVYTLYLILDATGHDALPAFSAAMLWFVLPLTLLTLVIVSSRSLRAR